MIRSTVVYTCDKCKNVIKEDSKAYFIQEIKVPKEYLVNSSLNEVTGNTYTAYMGSPKTYHLCLICCNEFKEFVEPSS